MTNSTRLASGTVPHPSICFYRPNIIIIVISLSLFQAIDQEKRAKTETRTRIDNKLCYCRLQNPYSVANN